MSSRVVRGALAAAAALAVVVSLGGCAAVAGNVADQVAVHQAQQVPPKLGADGKPSAGDCWKSTYKNANDYADWDNSKPINCSGAHQLYTFAVPELKGTYSGSEYDSSNYLKQKLQNDLDDRCNDAVEPQFSPIDEINTGRLDWIDLVPTAKQWAAGARWVRCDVGVIAFGSRYDAPKLENLPNLATLKSEMSRSGRSFEYCADDSKQSGGGPYSADAVYVNCTKSPEWVEADTYDIPSVNNAYPSRAVMKAVYESQCVSYWSNATHVTSPYYPSRSDWANGYQVVECWVGKK